MPVDFDTQIFEFNRLAVNVAVISLCHTLIRISALQSR